MCCWHSKVVADVSKRITHNWIPIHASELHPKTRIWEMCIYNSSVRYTPIYSRIYDGSGSGSGVSIKVNKIGERRAGRFCLFTFDLHTKGNISNISCLHQHSFKLPTLFDSLGLSSLLA